MRALVLSRYGRLGASSRLRMLQYFSALEANGISPELATFFDDAYLTSTYRGKAKLPHAMKSYITRISTMISSKDFDLLWIEKELLPWLPWGIEKALLPKNVPIIVDYDDAVFHQYDLHRHDLVRKFLGRKIDTVMAHSALVMAGNAYLGERAKAAGAKRIEIVPTVVDVNHYRVRSGFDSHSRQAIGWIGTPSTWAEYMEPILPTLTELAYQHGARLISVGAGEAADAYPYIENWPWSEETEVARIQMMDIGIMPLTDTPWARGKCGYKLIQYMACGVPVVASPVGVNSEIVEHGVNGFLASTEEEWREAIGTLLNDSSLRRRMGDAGRNKVEQSYSIQTWGTRVAKMLRRSVKI
jgi:glycosyltransferase involved in cell wall biosynthesis